MTIWMQYSLFGVFCGAASASPSHALQDVGQRLEGALRVVIVGSPGIDRRATLFWEQQLEQAGVDAWLLPVDPGADTESDLVDRIRELDVLLGAGEYGILAHGYAGRLVAEANPQARKMALVGAPLGPQLAPTIAQVPEDAVVQDGLPWPEDLTGRLPSASFSAEIARLYVELGDRTAVGDPGSEVFLVASGGDVVAPPECVRLPSVQWTDRQFWRADAFRFHLLSHADLLSDEAVIQKIGRFFRE